MTVQPKYLQVVREMELAKARASNLDRVLAQVNVVKRAMWEGDIGYGDYGYADFSGYSDWGYWDYGDNIGNKLLNKYSIVDLKAGYNVVLKK